MSSGKVPAIIRGILETRRIEAGETLTLRRWFYGDGVIHAEDAEALFKVNAVLLGKNEEFNHLFVQAVTDFLVYQQLPTGRISTEQADWLMDQMGGPEAVVATTTEINLLV